MLGPTTETANFNDKFQMKTGMEFDVGGVAIPKPTEIGLYLEKDRSLTGRIGIATFDLSAYAYLDGESLVDNLPLRDC